MTNFTARTEFSGALWVLSSTSTSWRRWRPGNTALWQGLVLWCGGGGCPRFSPRRSLISAEAGCLGEHLSSLTQTDSLLTRLQRLCWSLACVFTASPIFSFVHQKDVAVSSEAAENISSHTLVSNSLCYLLSLHLFNFPPAASSTAPSKGIIIC